MFGASTITDSKGPPTNDRSHTVTLRVLRKHAGELRDAILELRRWRDPISTADALDRLLERLTEPPVPAGQAVELTGPPELLTEVTVVAIDEAGERVSAGCTGLLRREADSAQVQAEVEALNALLELLRALEEAD